MTAPLLALVAAFFFAVASVCQKRGLQYASPLVAALVSVACTTIFIWLVAAVTAPLALLLTAGVVPFLVAGLIAPGLSRLALFTGVARVGVARASALVSTAPLFAVLIAIVVLGERPGGALLLGVAAVVVGGVLLAHRHVTDTSWRRRDLVFPLVGALGFSVRDILTRYGFADFASPVLAAAAATLVSLAVIALAALLQPAGTLRLHRRGMSVMAVSGVFEGLAVLAMWRALAAAPVSVVSPLVHAQPVFTILLTIAFLRDVERVSWRVAVAAAFIVAGVTIVLRMGRLYP
jgi:drug/metabolite transporter (DMT)-like permease